MLNALLLASILAVTLPPEPANHISDQAQLLSPQEKANLEAVFQTAYQQKGVKLGLLTLSELDDQPKVIAVRTLNYWNMSPDSVLLLVSLNPKKIYLQPGENLASTFDERTSTAITRSMVPAMKNGQFGQAVATAFDGVMVSLGGVAAAPIAQPPQVQRAAPQADLPTPSRARPQPIVADPVQVTAPAPEEGGGHGFLIFLLVAGTIGVLVFLAYRQHKANERRATRRTGGFTPNTSSGFDPDTGLRRGVRRSSSGGGVVVNNDNSNDGLLTGLVVGSMLNQPAQSAPAPAPVYTPPPAPSAPKKSFTERLSDVADSLPSFSSGSSSRGSGGGGSSWGSSSDSSSGSGGGGSSWSSSDSGGSSSDGGSSSGGGGSDW